MEDSATLSLSASVMIAVALIVNLLLIPFPFLWPYRLAKSRRRFPERAKFCLAAGLSSYLLVAVVAVVLMVIATGLSLAGLIGDSVISPLRVFFSGGWLVLALTVVLTSVWVSDYFAERWRDLVDRFLR